MSKFSLPLLGIFILFLASCTVEKRHYMDGYHVEWKHNSKMQKSADINRTEELSYAAAPIEKGVVDETLTTVIQNEEFNAGNTSPVEQKKLPISELCSSNGAKVKKETSFKHCSGFGGLSRASFAGKEVLSKLAVTQISGTSESAKSTNPDDILLIILAVFLPPLAVFLHEGGLNNRFWISLLLTLFFWLPGIIYALWVILG